MRWLPSLLLLLVLSAPAFAFDVVVENTTITSSPKRVMKGWIEVYVDLAPGESGLPLLAGFQAAVNRGAGTGVTFQTPYAVLPVTHAPLISQNFLANFGGDNSATRASATAFLSTPGSGTALIDGGGLYRIPFQVAAGTTGAFSLTLDTNPVTGTVLSNPLGASIPYNAVGGTLTVLPPEVPALPHVGAALLGLGLVGSGMWILRAQRATGP